MRNPVSTELNVLVSYFILGIICGLIFDLFKAARFGKIVNVRKLIIQDVLYYIIISVIIFNFILRVNGAEIRGYMTISAVIAFFLYRVTLSSFIVRTMIWINKLVKSIIKIMLFPVVTLCKILFRPFLKLKQKLLAKKTKIALTFKQICFTIKCNVGMLCIGNKFCKERKPCRRKQKPGKRV